MSEFSHSGKPLSADSQLLLLLGKMDGKLDNLQTQMTSVISRLDHQDQRVSKTEERIAVLEKDSDVHRKIAHDVNNLKQSLDGRHELINQFREAVRKVESLEKWRTEREGKEKGVGLFAKILWAAAPVILSVLISLGIVNSRNDTSSKTQVEQTVSALEQSVKNAE